MFNIVVMRKIQAMVKRIILFGLFIFPVVVWAAYKPVRVLAPRLVSGITCHSETICFDDASRYPEALKLYAESVKFVESNVGNLKEKPRIIFCSTYSCFKSFGFNNAAAKTIGKSGIVISPRGWKYFYLRHEIIHHLQSEKMGVLSQWYSPNWFTEGMAYSLSKDPREKLSPKFERYRAKFQDWYKVVGKEKLWSEARNL